MYDENIVFVMIQKAKPNNLDTSNSLLLSDTWKEKVIVPITWLYSVVGMFYKDDLAFPVDNTIYERSFL